MKHSSFIQKVLKNMKGKDKQQQDESVSANQKTFSPDLKQNEKTLRELLGHSQDVMFTKFKIKLHNGDQLNAIIVAIDGLVDEEAKRNNIIKPLIEPPAEDKATGDLQSIQTRLSVKTSVPEEDILKATKNVLKAQALLVIEGISQGLLISIEGFEIRAIDEPETEKTVRGPREGFIESTSVNLSLIRRKISDPSLRFETLEIGEYSQTGVTIAYVKDIAKPELINRVKERLQQIKIDMINSSGEVEQLIEDHPYSIFATVGNTERPDIVAAMMMEGRVVILVEGDPTSLFVPVLFVESIKNIEDYSSRPYYASLVRLLRFLAFIISITFPALYISAVNFNKSLIPSDMVVPITVARETVPFPLALEVIIMILMFEVIREAGIRLPEQVGTAISIVGPLILGEVAVASAIVGAPTVIIVSISYIAAFVTTPIADVTALLRIALFVAASIFGSYGLVVALLATFTHMVSLTSFGVPYMAPFSPLHFRDWKDAFVRFPTKLLKNRPESIPNQRSKKVTSVPDTEGKQ